MTNMQIRLRTKEGMYVHELRGVVLVTFVSKQYLEKALQFVVTKEKSREIWRKSISDIAGVELFSEVVEESEKKRICEYCGTAEAIGKTKRGINICFECAGPIKHDKAYVPWKWLELKKEKEK